MKHEKADRVSPKGSHDSGHDDAVGWQKAWEGISPAWQAAFRLAWASYQAGSIAVGAVVVDSTGSIVSEGRNRSGEAEGPPGVLAGSYIAHAEVNALAALRPGEYWDHFLITTLESCLLCTAATTHTHVGHIMYAARDPLWTGIERLPELNAHVARRFHKREWIDLGPLTLWAGALPKASRAHQLLPKYGGDLDAVFAEDLVLLKTTEDNDRETTLARCIIEAEVLPGDGSDLPDALAIMWASLEVPQDRR